MSTMKTRPLTTTTPGRPPGEPGFFGLRRARLDAAALERARPHVRAPRLPASLAERRRAAASAVRSAALSARAGRGHAADLEHRLVERLSFGWTLLEQQLMDDLGPDAYLERQLAPDQIDDGGLEQAVLDAFPSLSMTPYELYVEYGASGMEAVPIFELWLATLYRAVYSPRQLYERMVHFWSDHFSIDVASDFGYLLKPVDDREVVRPHALGRFPDLLRASARSPAMLLYLSNASNVVGHPNENYARELMELHTLGVDGGYTQEDVREVARCFTGWTVAPADFGEALGTFLFVPQLHDDDPKTVLGQSIPAGGGMADGERVLDLLAEHPSTARFVGRKLLRWVWGYEPTERMVDDVAGVYLDTDGDIASMLRAGAKWWRMARSTRKLKRPFHLFASALRAPFAGIQEPFFVLASLFAAGHLPFNWAPPNGYPDAEGYWSGLVMPRWNFAGLYTAGGDVAPAVVDLDVLDPQQSPDELTFVLDLLMTRGTLGDTSRQAVRDFLASRPAGDATVRDALGLVVASPEFQHY